MMELASCLTYDREDISFMGERDIMAISTSPWITKCVYAFQDPDYIYMALEYLAGERSRWDVRLLSHSGGRDDSTASVGVFVYPCFAFAMVTKRWL